VHLLQHGGTNAAGPRRAGSSTTRRLATVHGTATVPSGHAADEWTHLATQGQ